LSASHQAEYVNASGLNVRGNAGLEHLLEQGFSLGVVGRRGFHVDWQWLMLGWEEAWLLRLKGGGAQAGGREGESAGCGLADRLRMIVWAAWALVGNRACGGDAWGPLGRFQQVCLHRLREFLNRCDGGIFVARLRD
jgi:hypothetical protein